MEDIERRRPFLGGQVSATSLKRFTKLVIKKGIGLMPDRISDSVRIARDFHAMFGRYPNIFFPKTFNEKIQARKIFDRRDQLTNWTDKYAVREYVRTKIGDAVLPALYHVSADPHEIPFEQLPVQYVIKPTHGSGWVEIVRDGQKINKQDLIDKCLRWLSLNYFDLTREWAYRYVPRRIMVEEFLDDGTGLPPRDFKFFVFGGKVKVIQVDLDRFIRHKRDFYDLNWNRINCRLIYDNCDSTVARPHNLEAMIDYAQTLAAKIDFVRVDFYNIHGKIFFGELTITPENGLGKFYPTQWDEILGGFWKMRY